MNPWTIESIITNAKAMANHDLPEPEHIDSETCWCKPELDYTDPDTGVSVYVHRRTQ